MSLSDDKNGVLLLSVTQYAEAECVDLEKLRLQFRTGCLPIVSEVVCRVFGDETLIRACALAHVALPTGFCSDDVSPNNGQKVSFWGP